MPKRSIIMIHSNIIRKKNRRNIKGRKRFPAKTEAGHSQVYHHCGSLPLFIRLFQNLMPSLLTWIPNMHNGVFSGERLFGDRLESSSAQDVLKNQSLYWPQSLELLSLKPSVYPVKGFEPSSPLNRPFSNSDYDILISALTDLQTTSLYTVELHESDKQQGVCRRLWTLRQQHSSGCGRQN